MNRKLLSVYIIAGTIDIIGTYLFFKVLNFRAYFTLFTFGLAVTIITWLALSYVLNRKIKMRLTEFIGVLLATATVPANVVILTIILDKTISLSNLL